MDGRASPTGAVTVTPTVPVPALCTDADGSSDSKLSQRANSNVRISDTCVRFIAHLAPGSGDKSIPIIYLDVIATWQRS
jgi:hypothetical protein